MEYGSFGRRGIARVIDHAILVGIGFLFPPALPILGILGSWVYFAAFESSKKQATPGKMLLGVRVCTVEGSRLSFGQASGRYFGSLLSTLILGVGFLMALSGEKHQTLHDRLAGTVVLTGS